MNRRNLLRLGTSLVPACLAGPAFGQSNRKIVLGQSAAFSGPASALGERFKEGALLVFDQLNARWREWAND